MFPRPDLPPIDVGEILSRMPPILLEELEASALLDRIDSKFVVPASMVAGILERTAQAYRILDVDGSRLSPYRTDYLDTAERRLYHAHHSGRMPRHKVRIRTYLAGGTSFLEVKRRSHGGRTQKARLPFSGDVARVEDMLREADLLGVASAVPLDRLETSLRVDYWRVTMVSPGVPERVTVDFGLHCVAQAPGGIVSGEGARKAPVGGEGSAKSCSFPMVAVVEIKQAERADSPFWQELRRLGLRPGRISKYCLGLATLDQSLRRNRFKPAFRRVERIQSGLLLAS